MNIITSSRALCAIGLASLLASLPVYVAAVEANAPSPYRLSIRMTDAREAADFAREATANGECVRLDPVGATLWLHSC